MTTVLEAEPPLRTDIACKNCQKWDKRPHSVGNHAETTPSGCREKLAGGTRCPCDWPDGLAPAKKRSLGDFV